MDKQYYGSLSMTVKDFLKHYASPYYDPVKAHEYYEAHKKLKGRKSTSGLNEEGRKAASYIKKQLSEEKKSKIQQESDSIKSEIERDRAEIESHKTQMQSKISSLRAKLKSLGRRITEIDKIEIQTEINKLRGENKKMRNKLSDKIKTLSEQKKKNTEALNSEYDEKYEKELEALKNDPSFQKVTKKK